MRNGKLTTSGCHLLIGDKTTKKDQTYQTGIFPGLFPLQFNLLNDS